MRSARSTPTGHPTLVAASCRAGRGRRSVRAPGRRHARWRRPAVSRHLRHGTLHVTDRLDHVGPAPRRLLADTASTTSATVSGRPSGNGRRRRRRRARRAVRRSSRPRPPRPATVSPDRRHRARTCGPRVSADASRSSAARSIGDGSRPSRWRNSSSLTVMAASMSAVRLENTAKQLVGDAGDLGLPVDDRPPTRPPRRWVSSVRSTDWYRPPSIR